MMVLVMMLLMVIMLIFMMEMIIMILVINMDSMFKTGFEIDEDGQDGLGDDVTHCNNIVPYLLMVVLMIVRFIHNHRDYDG